MDVTERLRKWLNEGLEQPGKSQSDCARFMGLTPQIINRMARGTRRIQIDELPRLAEYLGVAPPETVPIQEAFLPVLATVHREGIWVEETAPQEQLNGELPPISHPSFPAEEQYCLHLDREAKSLSFERAFAICARIEVADRHHEAIRNTPTLVHVLQRKNGLIAHRLRYAERTGGQIALRDGPGASGRLLTSDWGELIGLVLAKTELFYPHPLLFSSNST